MPPLVDLRNNPKNNYKFGLWSVILQYRGYGLRIKVRRELHTLPHSRSPVAAQTLNVCAK